MVQPSLQRAEPSVFIPPTEEGNENEKGYRAQKPFHGGLLFVRPSAEGIYIYCTKLYYFCQN